MRERLHEFPNFINALFDPSCLISEQNPQLLLSIYNVYLYGRDSNKLDLCIVNDREEGANKCIE